MDVLCKGHRRVKVLFIQARTENPEGPIFPLGIGYLAAMMPKEYRMRAIDMNVEVDPFKTIRHAGEEFKPDIICISIRNIKVARPGEHIPSDKEVKEMVFRIKCLIPNAQIIAGGAGFSLYAGPFMRSIPEIDFGIVGEGELALPAFLHQFPNPLGIRGVACRQGEQIILQGIADRPNFADLPWPKREIFSMEFYRNYPTSVGVMTKRGCPYRCIHCSDIYLLGKKIRNRCPEDIVEELLYLKKDFGIGHFMFADQEFNIPAEYTKEFLRQMIRADLKLRWSAYFTADGLDEEMVGLFKKSGCFIVSFSPDCLSDKMMRTIRKGYVSKDVYKANQIIKKIGIPVTYNFMLGLPGEDVGDLLKTLLFIFKTKFQLKKLFKLHGLFIVPVRIYPFTKLREIAVQEELVKADDDLMIPRFYRSKSKLINLADKAIVAGISLVWKLKHKLFKHLGKPIMSMMDSKGE